MHDLTCAAARPTSARWSAQRSGAKQVPAFVWRSTTGTRRLFLQALFEGDGSSSLLPRNSIQISYSTRSDRLAREVQQLLLEFGIVSSLCRYATARSRWSSPTDVTRDCSQPTSASWAASRPSSQAELGQVPATSSAMSADHVPFVADFLRAAGAERWTERDWLRRHNVDRIERWERDRDIIDARVTNAEALEVVTPLVDGRYHFAEVATIEDAGTAPVFSLRVETDDHAFLTNGFVSHNTEAG